MSAHDSKATGASVGLMVPSFILFVLLSCAVIRGPSLISANGIGSAVIVVAPLILATYTLTVIVMAGRAGVDLSIGPLIGFINVGLIRLIEFGILQSPISVFAYVIAVGVAYQLLMGLIIVYVRVQPIIVSLSGYLALVGLNLLILPRPGGVAPDWMMDWGSGTTIFSPVLAILVIATAAWYLLASTAFFGHLRLMGSDERAAYTSGVRINIVRLGAHCIAGVYAGLAAICFTSLISSGDPTQGTTLTLMAVTALVLGGANLAGGRGGAIGSLLGALNIYLVTYLLATFNFGTVQSYVTDLSYGAMLVASLLISAVLPQLQKIARYVAPAIFFAVAAFAVAGVVAHATLDAGGKSTVAAAPAVVAQVATSAAESSGAGGTILLVVIGLVALVYVARKVISHPRPPMIAFAALIVVVGLGLIFHPHVGQLSASGLSASGSIDYSFDYLSQESLGTVTLSSAGPSPLFRAALGLLGMMGIVFLASTIIRLNLIDARVIDGVGLRSALLPLLALGPIALIAALSGGDAASAGVFGSEGLVFAAVGAALFVLMWSPVPLKLRNISNLYIVVFGVVAFGCVYFSGAATHGEPSTASQTVSGVLRPAVLTAESFAANLTPSRPPGGVNDPSLTRMVAYSLLTIFGLQLALWLAMRHGRSLRDALLFGPIVVGAAMAWSAMFHLASVPLSQAAVALGLAVVTAPLVWRVLSVISGVLDRPAIVASPGARALPKREPVGGR